MLPIWTPLLSEHPCGDNLFLLSMGMSPSASVALGVFAFPLRSLRLHLLYNLQVGSWRQQSGPPLSLLSLMLTQGVPSACPCTPCAPGPRCLECPGLGTLHYTHCTHISIFPLLGTPREGDAAVQTQSLNCPQRRKWLSVIFYHFLILFFIALYCLVLEDLLMKLFFVLL